MGVKQDLIAGFGEFTGTTMFLLLALGGAKTALLTTSTSQTEGLYEAESNTTIMFIAVSFGISLLCTAWVWYRITGGLFNPAITLALYLIGGLNGFRAVLLTFAQILGGIAGAALVAALIPTSVKTVTCTLGTEVNVAQGLFIEAFITGILVLTVLFLAAEKHKSTYLAPLGIGLVLLSCQLFAVPWTGAGQNPARCFGPAVVSHSFVGYHWIYWVGPLIGSLLAVGLYVMLKAFDYTSVVFGQDADHEMTEEEKERAQRHMVGSALFKRGTKFAGKHIVFHSHRGPNSNIPAEAAPNGGPLDIVSSGETAMPATLVPFDAANPEMQQALREGRASIVDINDTEMGPITTATEGDGVAVPTSSSVAAPSATTHMNGHSVVLQLPSMRAEAQDVGGLGMPGSTHSGFAGFEGVQKLLVVPQKQAAS